MGIERREEDRTQATLRVEYQGASDLLIDYTENLSKGGVFISTDHAFEKGETISLLLSFPGLVNPFKVRGLVAWCKTDGDPGVGIEFQDVQGQELEEFIRRLKEQDSNLVAKEVSILVADDNPHLCKMIEDSLQTRAPKMFKESIHFSVKTVGNDSQVLRVMNETRFDVVILDGEIPENGACSILENLNDELTTTVVLSKNEKTLQEAKAAGANFLLQKPIKFKSLLGILKTKFSISESHA